MTRLALLLCAMWSVIKHLAGYPGVQAGEDVK